MEAKIYPGDPLMTLRSYGGYYDCPKDDSGKRLGPLVGYAGTYVDDKGRERQKVGEIYCNFAKADNYPWLLQQFAHDLDFVIDHNDKNHSQILCAAPLGGYSFSTLLGLNYRMPVIKAEKKVTKLATKTSREVTDLVFARDQVEPGKRYAIVEDVCNNFSTTEKLAPLITEFGGSVSRVICLLNRSMDIDNFYRTKSGLEVPITQLVRIRMKDYHQDDPYVRGDIEAGNVIWKPKDDWEPLEEAMTKAA